MLLSSLGLVEPAQPDITLSGLNPFELRQSRIEANQGGTHLNDTPWMYMSTHAEKNVHPHLSLYRCIYRIYIIIFIYIYMSVCIRLQAHTPIQT